jgi:hypothetical protein
MGVVRPGLCKLKSERAMENVEGTAGRDGADGLAV